MDEIRFGLPRGTRIEVPAWKYSRKLICPGPLRGGGHRRDDQVELARLERRDQLVEGGVDEGEADPQLAAELGRQVGVDAADLGLGLAHGPVEHVGGEGVVELHRGVRDVGADPDLPGRADPLGQALAQVGEALGHRRGVGGPLGLAGPAAAGGQGEDGQQRQRPNGPAPPSRSACLPLHYSTAL